MVMIRKREKKTQKGLLNKFSSKRCMVMIERKCQK
jgi:hypothetical protein